MELDPVRLHDERAGGADDPAGPLRAYQRQMTLRMFDALMTKEVVFVGQAPTAFGKTVVIRAVVLALIESGKRALIVEPTYSRLKELKGYLEPIGLLPTLLKSRNKFIEDGIVCPVISKRPNYLWCREQQRLEEQVGSGCKGFTCEIKQQDTVLRETALGITVTAALVNRDSWLDQFDAAIFDESHTLPGQLEQNRIHSIGSEQLQKLRDYSIGGEALRKATAFLEKNEARSEIRTIGKTNIDMIFGGSISDVYSVVKESVNREPAYEAVPATVRNAFHALEGVASAAEQSGNYKFVLSGDMIYAAPPSQFLNFRSPNRKSKVKTSVALVSATIESPKYHANDCGFSQLGLVAPYVSDTNPVLERSEQRIFGLIDGPSLKVTGEATDDQTRVLANEIIIDVLSHFRHPTLILCRSERDKKRICAALSESEDLRSRIINVDDSQFETADDIEAHIRTEMSKGMDLVVATASSKLWEGANLDIQFLVVDSLPYVPHDPWKSRQGSWVNSKPFRTMIRRFQQGVGRLIRGPGQWGVCVVVDGRLHAQWKIIRSQLPLYLTQDVVITRRDKLVEEIQTFVAEATSRVEQGQSRPSLLRQSKLEN